MCYTIAVETCLLSGVKYSNEFPATGRKEGQMRLLNAILASAAILLGATASGSALARGGHGGGGHGGGGHGGGGHVGGGSHIGSGGGHFRGGHVGGFHSGARIGVFVGAPLFAPWYYYPPAPYYYDYPPAYAEPTPLPAYYGQSPGQTAPAQQPSYWYYCSSSNSYYPYVKACPEGWQHVTPQPAPPS